MGKVADELGIKTLGEKESPTAGIKQVEAKQVKTSFKGRAKVAFSRWKENASARASEGASKFRASAKEKVSSYIKNATTRRKGKPRDFVGFGSGKGFGDVTGFGGGRKRGKKGKGFDIIGGL